MHYSGVQLCNVSGNNASAATNEENNISGDEGTNEAEEETADEEGKYEQAAFRMLMGIFGCIMGARVYRNALRDCNVSMAVDETPGGGGGRGCVGDESNYGESMNISDQRMYQQGQHFNRHGRGMGYSNKKEYEQAARVFFEQNRNTAEIYEGIWNSSRGGQTQIIVRQDGIQLIVNKETGQIIDYYEGTSLSGFINIERVQ